MPLAELTGVLERVAAARGGVLGVLPGLLVEPDESWTPLQELTREPYTLLSGLIEQTAGRYDAPRHVGAALLWKTLGYWLTFPMAVGWALDGRAPVMRFEDTYFKQSEAGVTVAATAVTVVDSPQAIAEALRQSQEPLVKAISGQARVGARTLWGSTAEAFAHPMTAVLQGDYMGLLRAVGRPVDGLLEQTADGYRRRTCCLWVTLPEAEPCSTCCVLRESCAA
ncbi:(2Fe-2S)-binding protein [Nonomuraea dietziae]|uniref:(2Fe-2S)-binding protein n=1 Tax=Nonomuraea dietziae TaxID=65515 RepID=UPI0034106AFB